MSAEMAYQHAGHHSYLTRSTTRRRIGSVGITIMYIPTAVGAGSAAKTGVISGSRMALTASAGVIDVFYDTFVTSVSARIKTVIHGYTRATRCSPTRVIGY